MQLLVEGEGDGVLLVAVVAVDKHVGKRAAAKFHKGVPQQPHVGGHHDLVGMGAHVGHVDQAVGREQVDGGVEGQAGGLGVAQGLDGELGGELAVHCHVDAVGAARLPREALVAVAPVFQLSLFLLLKILEVKR